MGIPFRKAKTRIIPLNRDKRVFMKPETPLTDTSIETMCISITLAYNLLPIGY